MGDEPRWRVPPRTPIAISNSTYTIEHALRIAIVMARTLKNPEAVRDTAAYIRALAWHNYKRARNKNRVLIFQIKELYNVRQMINPTTTPPIEKRDPNLLHSGLCERFDNAM